MFIGKTEQGFLCESFPSVQSWCHCWINGDVLCPQRAQSSTEVFVWAAAIRGVTNEAFWMSFDLRLALGEQNHLPKLVLLLMICTWPWKTLAQQNKDVQIMAQSPYTANPHTTANNNYNYSYHHHYHHLYVNPGCSNFLYLSTMTCPAPHQNIMTERFQCFIFSYTCSLPPCCVEISTDLHLMFWIMHWRHILETIPSKWLHAVTFHNSTNS